MPLHELHSAVSVTREYRDANKCISTLVSVTFCDSRLEILIGGGAYLFAPIPFSKAVWGYSEAEAVKFAAFIGALLLECREKFEGSQSAD